MTFDEQTYIRKPLGDSMTNSFIFLSIFIGQNVTGQNFMGFILYTDKNVMRQNAIETKCQRFIMVKAQSDNHGHGQ